MCMVRMFRTSPWVVLAAGVGLLAQTSPADTTTPTDKKPAFKLGEITVPVTGKLEVLEQVHTRVTAEKLETFNTDTVGAALTQLPGLSLSMTSKNETVVYLRGHDSRRVPVYLDGIPCYVPYEGQMDFARFGTFDLAEIQVAKGFSSVLFGPNTLGGAINLVTRRPSKTFEGDGTVGIFAGDGKKAAVNIGSNQGRTYVQVGASTRDAGNFPMSSSFKPNPREDGGRRENSYAKDTKGSLKCGFTPNDTDEYVLGFMIQKGDKGQPVSTDFNTSARYWRWPQWDKQSLYLTTHHGLGAQSYLRVRAYYDAYKNTLNAYTDATFTRLATTGGMAPTGVSLYDDFTKGAIVEFGTQAIQRHSLRAVIQTKTDVHREDNGTNAWKRYRDELRSVGLEDAIVLSDRVDLSAGVGYDEQRPMETGPYFRAQVHGCLQGQVGAFWKMTPAVQVYATAAQKDRFPTLKDRFSLRFATYIENPELRPERSKNVDLGVKASPRPWLLLEGAVFQSDITDLIQEVKFVSGQRSQMQNIGRVRHRGVEFSCGLKPTPWLDAGLTYTYLDRENLSNPETRLTSTPRNRLTGSLRLTPSPAWQIQASVENQDRMWDSNTTRLPGYTSTHLAVIWKPLKPLSCEVGFTNALDRDYQLVSGYPMPGRTWYANARYRF